MPKSAALSHPDVEAHVAKEVAKAIKVETAKHVAIIKDVSTEHATAARESGDTKRAKAHTAHGADVVRRIKAALSL
jgi:hypothetical protein